MFSVITIKDEVLDEVVWSGPDRLEGEKHFLDTLTSCISNFNEYTSRDIDVILDQGYERFGNGSICFIDHSDSSEVQPAFDSWWDSQMSPEHVRSLEGMDKIVHDAMKETAKKAWEYLLIHINHEQKFGGK